MVPVRVMPDVLWPVRPSSTPGLHGDDGGRRGELPPPAAE